MDSGVLIVGGVAVALLDLYAYYRLKYSEDVLEHSFKLKNEALLKKHASAFESVEIRSEKESHALAMEELVYRMKQLSGELRLLAESIDVNRLNGFNADRLKIKGVA